MDIADIEEIETHSGVKLPQRYRDILLNYPQQLLDLNDEFDTGPEHFQLFREKSKLLFYNPKGRNWETWRPEYFVIGENGCGETFVIDTSDPAAPVYVYSNHVGEFDGTEDGRAGQLCSCIEEWVDEIIGDNGT